MPRFEKTNDVGNHFGQFLHLTNSNSVSNQSLAEVWRNCATVFVARLPLLGCPDATRPDFRGPCPKVQYANASRTPEDVAIEDLGEMMVELLN